MRWYKRASKNQDILDEVSAAWFRAKKTKPIWAKKMESAQTIDTLEGEVEAKAGDWLCKGEKGEPWPQKEKKLFSTYDKTDEVKDGYTRFKPRSDDEGVMAAKIDHPFKVQAQWGLISGKAGDYIAKAYKDKNNEDPKDVWIVANDLFKATYSKI